MISMLFAFSRCRRGIAAMEFALLLPIGLVLLFGISEVSTALLIDRKVSRATHIGADLVAQETTMDFDKVADLFTAMETILVPFPPTTAYMRITSVWLNPDTNDVEVDWSEARNGVPDSGKYVLPNGLIAQDGDSVIVAHVIYDHSPLFDGSGFGALTLEDKAYLKPRRTTKITGP